MADPGFAKLGDHGECTEREAKQGSADGAPSRVGQRHCWGIGVEAPLKLKAFVNFLYKEWPKAKDLSEHLPPYLSHAAMTSPKFWSLGGCPVHPWLDPPLITVI